ncbi:hypothetical protein T484DRAFT_2708171 [Baffinella frigidus]|nr:hypothetical protein T484DRAFT_2708171 [Cryptophyta sp. CCMP2293]|mmetsp:Transcript_49181/g.117051  ORF Transcript_49181/g.117051 Transcript_49181/m.117051 type:complete len:361 (+) Transcript_49181:148-1230(+)
MLRIRDGRISGVFLACLALLVGVAAVAGQGVEVGGQARNLVLGTQNGLLAQEVRVFLASLRSTGSMAEVVIFSAEESRHDLHEVAATFNALVMSYNPVEISAKHGPANLHRFSLFRQFLEDAGLGSFDQVFLCDIRDVYFQSDPFQSLAVPKGIGVAIEPAHLPIGQCDVHMRWLSSECPAYAREGMGKVLADKLRSCAGTTIGTPDSIHAYCQAMEDEAERTVTEIGEAQGKALLGRATTFDGEKYHLWCNDQAMHNVLLWTGKLNSTFPVRLYSAEDSLLATVGTMTSIKLSDQAEVLVECPTAGVGDGVCSGGEQPAAVVHQYDRVEALVRTAQSLYGLPGETFLTFQQKHFPGQKS